MLPVRETPSTSNQKNLLEENDYIRNENNYTPSGEKLKSHGITYHDHVIMLYLCKFMTKKDFNFTLTCEVEEGGKFDDIVIFYLQDSRILCRMIQVKSKTKSTNTLTRSMLVEKSEPFDLNVYFLSYLEIMFKHNFEAKFKCEIKDLILHTNIDVGQELKDDLEMYEDELIKLRRCYRLKNGQTDFKALLTERLLDSLRNEISKREGKMKLIKSKQDKKMASKQDIANQKENNYIEYLKRLTSDDRINCIDIFFEKLKFHVKQPDKDKLADLIKREIKLCLKKYKLETVRNSNQSVIVYTGLYNKVYTFHSNPKVTVLTDEQLANWFKEASRRSMTRLTAFHDMNMNLLTSRGYFVTKESVERLKTNMECNRDEFLKIIANAGTIFTLIKLNDMFKGKKYNLITENQFLSMSSTIEDDIEIEKTEYLIITCEDNITTNLTDDIEDLLDRIRDESESVCKDLKKIILVSKSGENYSNDTVIIDETEWNDLKKDTQKRIECENTICLQGRKVKLADIHISNFSDLLNNEILYDVVHSAVTLGKPIDSGNTCSISNFIERRISLQNKISKNIFKVDSKDDIFIISNINETEFQQLKSTSRCQLIFSNIANSRHLFLNLCSEHERGNVTLLRHENNEFFCQESKSIDRLLPYVNENSPRLIELRDSTAIDDRIILIIAEPGMGKSNLITVLASRMIKETPRTLVVKINLNNYTKEFSKLLAEERTFTEQSEAVDFIVETQLYNTEGYKKTFERNYFKRHFNLPDGIFILLDGFDEIAPDYREIVIDLIKLIKKISSVRLWLTSRPQEKKYLETELNTLSCALVRFTSEDQNNFFLTYWNRHETDDQNARLKKFVERLINVTSKSLRDDDQLMTGIPLQCRMLGEVYQETFEEYFNSEQDDVEVYLPESLDILELYNKFIEKKRIIYEEEKSKRDLTVITNKIQSSKDSDTFIKTHSYFGLCAVFMKAHLDDILTEKDREKMDKYIREVDSGNEKTGIIRIAEHKTLAFIHKTFAEYFAARWFYYRIKIDGPDRQRLVDFFKKHFFKSEFEMVRRFFDRLSAKGEIFKAILNNDEKCLIKMLETDSFLVGSLADFDRNHLHLCAAYEYNNLINILIEKRVQSMTEDSLCGWKPIEYACAVKNWKNVDTFLGVNIDDETVYKCMKDKNMLFLATRNAYLNLIQYLIKCGTNVNSQRNKIESSLYLDADDRFDFDATDGDTVLHYAARGGNIDIVKTLIKANGDPNFKNNKGCTPLFSAAHYGHYKVFKCLIEDAGAAHGIIDRDGNTVLHYAAKGGNVDIVKLLIKAHADSNITNNTRCASLHLAAENGHYKIFKYLMEKADAAIDILDKNGDTVLHYAARGGSVDIVKLLIKAHVDSNIRNNDGRTFLHLAAEYGHYETFKCLIEDTDAATDIIDCDGNTVLHHAARGGNVNTVKQLIKAHVDSNITNNDGRTPLHLAAIDGHYEIFKCLIEDANAATDSIDSRGNTALHYASMLGSVNIVKLLIRVHVDSNIRNNYGCASLHFAAEYGHYEIFKCLIEEGGAATDVVDRDGDTVLHYAARSGNVDIVKLLIMVHVDSNIRNNDGCTSLHLAADNGHYEIFKRLIADADAEIHIIDCDGNNVLHYAAGGGNVDIVKLLIKAHVSSNITNDNRCTPLHLAAKYNYDEIFKCLIEDAGAAVTDRIDNDGNTVLHYAARSGNMDIIKLLIKARVDANIRNNDGCTPIHLAVRYDDDEVFKYLTEDADAATNVTDNDGNTVLHYAARRGNVDIVKLLIEAHVDSSITNNDGCTPLHLAAKNGRYKVFKYLIENADASIDIPDKNGDTVLQYATSGGNVDIAKLLKRVLNV